MSQSFQSTRKVALERANHECAFCGVTDEQHRQDNGSGLDVHHVLPRSAGGSNKPSNLLAVCRGCHKTLEHSQGAALKEIRDADLSGRDELEKQVKEFSERNAELHNAVNGLVERVHELERRNRDVDYYKELLGMLNVRGEVVTRKLGTKTYCTTDSEKAMEHYKEWGSCIEQMSLFVSESDVERKIDRIKETLGYIERRGYKDE